MEFDLLLNELLRFSLGLPRMLAIFAMIPIFGRGVLPGSVRNAVAISFAMFMYPVNSAGIDVTTFGALAYGAIIVKEVVLGILIGVGLAVLFWAVESMGFVIDNQRGSTMASSVDPLTGSQTSPLGILMMQVVTIYFFVSGAVLVALLAIYESYVLFPVASFYPSLQLTDAAFFLSLLDRIMALAVLLAAPALIAMFLSELALGLISRFAPTLNVFFLSMPVKSAVGVLVLVLSIGAILEIWEGEFARLPTHVTLLRDLLS